MVENSMPPPDPSPNLAYLAISALQTSANFSSSCPPSDLRILACSSSMMRASTYGGGGIGLGGKGGGRVREKVIPIRAKVSLQR